MTTNDPPAALPAALPHTMPVYVVPHKTRNVSKRDTRYVIKIYGQYFYLANSPVIPSLSGLAIHYFYYQAHNAKKSRSGRTKAGRTKIDDYRILTQ